MAERVGFEPTVPLPARRISSAVLSTTQPPLRNPQVPAGRTGAGSARRLAAAAWLAKPDDRQAKRVLGMWVMRQARSASPEATT